ncbi:uncharacterized protein LOC143363745 [Halictus rubicundus]|uniref:uncharacterized protein LOC143363745 n=1 Tax=Halictus rubicundus TaxID=77578 RepID=UPI004035A091
MSPTRKVSKIPKHNISKKRIIFESSDSSDSSKESQPIEPSQIETPNVHSITTNKDEGQLAALSRQYIEIKYDVKLILNKLENIERLLNVRVTGGSSHDELDNNFLNQLPLASVVAINDFDTMISEHTEKFNSLVCIYCCLVCGTPLRYKITEVQQP